MAEEYGSAYTGPQIDEAVGAVRENQEAWSAKQDKLTGAAGQVVGFGADGRASALTLTAEAPVTATREGDALTLGLEGGTVSKPNLLDNAYWAGPDAIINQRGVSGTISTPGYFIDRWKLVDGSVTVTDSGLVLSGTIAQILETAPDGEVTASALTTAGIITPDYDAASKTFSITGTGQTFLSAKLEQGPRQTIAYQDAGGSWVFSGPVPNKALELAKCQRYQMVIGGPKKSYCAVGLGAGRKTDVFVSIPLPVPLRASPTIVLGAESGYSDVAIRLNGDQYQYLSVLGEIVTSDHCVHVAFPADNVTPGACYDAYVSPGKWMILDANL